MNSAFASIHQWQSACAVGLASFGQVADRGSLVVVRGNFIEIYEVFNERKSLPLQKRFRIRLQGVPDDIKLCRFPGSKYDSILLSFRPARLSRLDFNPDTFDFETTAMFSYENPKRKIGNLQDFQPALIAVDPVQRCAVMAVSDSIIMAWPIKDRVQLGQVAVASDISKSILSAQNTISTEVILIDLAEYGVRRIKSMAFLNGFLEPSLLILHEPELTWAGRTAVKPSTCVITAVSINVDTCKHFLIANEKDIFYDAHTVLPLAMPIGGALIISCNMIIHYKQKIEFALSLNDFGDQCTTLRVVPTPSKCPPMTLDRAVCAAISHDVVVIGTCDGELYSLALHTLGDSIRSMSLSKITKTHIASCICPSGSNLLFLGSKLGDSLLIEYSFSSSSRHAPATARALKRAKSDGAADGFDLILSHGTSDLSPAINVKMRDSLFSISPITKVQIGMNTQVTPERSEIVACSGYDRTGALVVISDCVRPTVLASFDLKGPATGVWSAAVPSAMASADSLAAPIYLIVSLESRTIIKRSENNELKAADEDGFALDIRTIYAGEIRGCVIQITRKEVRLLTGSGWKVFGFASDFLIHSADVKDSFITLLSADGDVVIGELQQSNDAYEIDFQPVTLDFSCAAFCLYKDSGRTGLFSRNSSRDQQHGSNDSETMEDIEALLFGNSSPEAPASHTVSSAVEKPICVLVTVLSNGCLQILSLPERNCLFMAADCTSGYQILKNNHPSPNHEKSSSISVSHLLFTTLSEIDTARPSLFISLNNGDILIYTSFLLSNVVHGEIPLAFSRFHHGIITRPLAASGIEFCPFAVAFTGIRGLSGVFVGGNRPQWFWGNRDYLHSIAQVGEGIVSAFCPFKGPTFCYCLDNTLKICSLSSDINYDLQVTVKRIPIRLTPHLLTYHAESGIYALVTLKSVKIDLIEGESNRTVPLQDKRCQMHLCMNSSMKIVDTFKDFEKDDEAILCVEDTPIAHGEKKLQFLSVGTGNIESEEVSCRGRLLLFRIHDTTPSDKTGAGYRYNLVFESKEIGPVSAITAVQGFLCVCVGLRVIMYRWETDRLVGCAFYDADFYSVALQSAKGFILLADIYNSAHLLFWEPRLKQIMFLGKDPVKTEVYGSEFLIDGEDISIAICDGEANLRLVGYAPYQPDSLGGRRLLRRADIHIGTRISSFSRIRGSDLPGVPLSVGSRYPLLGSGVDGSIICLCPVADTVYRRLYSLTTLMTYQIRHAAGLNPRQFRTWRSTEHGTLHTTNVARNIVDMDFLLGFASMDTYQQEKMALGIGSNPEQIIDDLLQLQLTGSLQLYVS